MRGAVHNKETQLGPEVNNGVRVLFVSVHLGHVKMFALSIQTQLDLLKRVNAQLTKDKETLTRQLQHARQAVGHRAAAPATSAEKTDRSNVKALQVADGNFIPDSVTP
jgi:hypothetical protein